MGGGDGGGPTPPPYVPPTKDEATEWFSNYQKRPSPAGLEDLLERAVEALRHPETSPEVVSYIKDQLGHLVFGPLERRVFEQLSLGSYSPVLDDLIYLAGESCHNGSAEYVLRGLSGFVVGKLAQNAKDKPYSWEYRSLLQLAILGNDEAVKCISIVKPQNAPA